MLFLIIKTLDQLKPIYWMVLYRVYVFVPLENKQQKQETPIARIEICYLFLFVLFLFLSFGLCLFVFVTPHPEGSGVMEYTINDF
jgi:Ni,Fe-hydrogenase I cytochrome b subunit